MEDNPIVAAASTVVKLLNGNKMMKNWSYNMAEKILPELKQEIVTIQRGELIDHEIAKDFKAKLEILDRDTGAIARSNSCFQKNNSDFLDSLTKFGLDVDRCTDQDVQQIVNKMQELSTTLLPGFIKECQEFGWKIKDVTDEAGNVAAKFYAEGAKKRGEKANKATLCTLGAEGLYVLSAGALVAATACTGGLAAPVLAGAAVGAFAGTVGMCIGSAGYFTAFIIEAIAMEKSASQFRTHSDSFGKQLKEMESCIQGQKATVEAMKEVIAIAKKEMDRRKREAEKDALIEKLMKENEDLRSRGSTN